MITDSCPAAPLFPTQASHHDHLPIPLSRRPCGRPDFHQCQPPGRGGGDQGGGAPGGSAAGPSGRGGGRGEGLQGAGGARLAHGVDPTRPRAWSHVWSIRRGPAGKGFRCRRRGWWSGRAARCRSKRAPGRGRFAWRGRTARTKMGPDEKRGGECHPLSGPVWGPRPARVSSSVRTAPSRASAR